MVKRATRTCNLFCNTAAKRFEKQCCAFYHLCSNLSCSKSGCCKLCEYWLLIGLNCAGVTTYTEVTSLVAKQVELLSTFCNNFLQPATSWFVARQVWFVGGKTRKTAFQHVCSNVGKQGARFCGLIYRIFTLNKTDNHESREVQGIIWFFILLGEHE